VDITFALPHLFAPGVSPRENAEGLRVLLDTLIRLNVWFLRHHSCRPLYASGVVYARTDVWEPIPALYSQGYHGTDQMGSRFPAMWGVFGDCKSLSAALIAQYRNEGKEASPEFRYTDNSHGRIFHILVRTAKGFEDPSVKLGMNRHESAYFTRSF
jgi:hypothetical protein